MSSALVRRLLVLVAVLGMQPAIPSRASSVIDDAVSALQTQVDYAGVWGRTLDPWASAFGIEVVGDDVAKARS